MPLVWLPVKENRLAKLKLWWKRDANSSHPYPPPANSYCIPIIDSDGTRTNGYCAAQHYANSDTARCAQLGTRGTFV